MSFVRVSLDSKLIHIKDDEAFREKLFTRMEKSNGWGFSMVYKGLHIGVTPLDENHMRRAYLEEEEEFPDSLNPEDLEKMRRSLERQKEARK